MAADRGAFASTQPVPVYGPKLLSQLWRHTLIWVSKLLPALLPAVAPIWIDVSVTGILPVFVTQTWLAGVSNVDPTGAGEVKGSVPLQVPALAMAIATVVHPLVASADDNTTWDVPAVIVWLLTDEVVNTA
jgi:hypothetical protein